MRRIDKSGLVAKPMHLKKPLHTAVINRQQLRFFKTPWNDGRPDLPWHSVDDLLSILGMDRRRCALARLTPLETISTEGGNTIVAPHFIARALFKLADSLPEVTEAYAWAHATALHKLPKGTTIGFTIHAHVRHVSHLVPTRTVEEFNADPGVTEAILNGCPIRNGVYTHTSRSLRKNASNVRSGRPRMVK
jgi:hypothetical protein